MRISGLILLIVSIILHRNDHINKTKQDSIAKTEINYLAITMRLTKSFEALITNGPAQRLELAEEPVKNAICIQNAIDRGGS